MIEGSIKQNGFRTLSDEEITAVSGGGVGAGTGSAYWDAILGVYGDQGRPDTHHQIAQDGGSDGGGLASYPFLNFNLSDTLTAAFGPDGTENIDFTLQQEIRDTIARIMVGTDGDFSGSVDISTDNGKITISGDTGGNFSVGYTGTF